MGREHRVNRGALRRRRRVAGGSLCILYAFLVPAVGITLLFQYLPMFSNVIAFLEYDFSKGWFGLASPFVGFKNFGFLGERWFYEIMGRTVYYSVAIIAFSFPVPLILALLMNELRSARFQRTVQTISYVPRFVSWVTIGGLVYVFLTSDHSGLVNNARIAMGADQRISFMQDHRLFLPLLVITQNWKEAGWGTILYLAALTTINPELYEAADVDGASRWQKVRFITFPGLVPTTSILLILTMGGLFSANFDQMMNLQNAVIRPHTDVINVFTYFRGIVNHQYSFATAVGLFQGVISFALILVTNRVSKAVSGTGLL